MEEEIFLQCTKVYSHQTKHLKSENANIIWFNLYQRFRLENQIVKMPYMTKRGKGERQLP